MNPHSEPRHRRSPRAARPLLLAALVGLATIPFAAAGENIDIPVGTEPVRGYLAQPPESRIVPGIVLLHDAWGLNEQIRDMADRIARLGYVVIAPDLYKGKLPADPGLAREMVAAVDETRAVAIVVGSADRLRRIDRMPARPIAAVGFGLGGRIGLLAALRGADLKGVVAYYARVETTREALAPLRAPVLAIFGGADPLTKAADIKAFEATLKETGRDVTVINYPGVGHAFMDESRADFEGEMSQDAWVRMRDWLEVKLLPWLPGRRPPAPAPGPNAAPPPPAPAPRVQSPPQPPSATPKPPR